MTNRDGSSSQVLCLTSSSLAWSTVSKCIDMLRRHELEDTKVVRSEQRAKNAIKSGQFAALVIATAGDDHPATTSFLEMGKRLLKFTSKRYPFMLRIVFSRKACETQLSRHAFIECGADAVVCTPEKVFEALVALVTPPTNGTPLTHYTPSSYAPLTSRYRREEQLMDLAGEETIRVEQIWKMTKQLERKLSLIPKEYTQHINDKNKHIISTGKRIRVVHVSDTHNLHRHLCLTPGDLFIHTGNITDNSSSSVDLLLQFKDFLDWLDKEVCHLYDQVVFIAGTHDVLLDPINCDDPGIYEKARVLLQSFLAFHPNVSYLENSGIRYRGLYIFGSPTMLCHNPGQSQKTKCNAFERDFFMENDFGGEKIDILLTHRPPLAINPEGNGSYSLPHDILYQKDSHRRNVLSPFFSLQKRRRRGPRLHLSGHESKTVGIFCSGMASCDTIFMNGSQQRMLRHDKFGGGTPLVVDLPHT